MLPRHSRPACALLGLALLGGSLAACGSSSSGNGVAAKAPAEIVAATKAAADAARSAHVYGSIVSNGSPITLDLDLATGAGRGRLALNGLGFELIQTHGTVYIKGSSAFYRHIGGAAAAQLLQGRWLKAPTTSPEFASISSLTDLHRLVDGTLANHGTLAKTPTRTVNGQQVVGLRDTSRGGILYVASTGKPYPVQLANEGKSGGTVSFDRWNESLSIKPPANAIDLAQLRSGH
jgi:hypothetical protein